jgi:hypothetical protein
MHQISNILLYVVTYHIHNMSCSILLEKGEEEEQKEEHEGSQLEQGIPVCGANLSSPVVDQAYYIDEIHYRIGNRIYIENAD